jgi:dephospho-CoA kinase
MLRVGLTGGIGSGKSEVSRRLASYGAVIIDADAIAREVVEPGTPGLAAVLAEFGPGVLAADGSLDREAVARLVFADAGMRAKLNAIVHPLVGERMAELQRAAPAGAIVVFDVPLMAENDLAGGFDLVVVVDAPQHTQLDRLVRLRGMTKEQAMARIAAQASRDQRLAIVGERDIVIDNSGPLTDLDRQARGLWAELRRRARDGQARQ